MSTDTIPIVGVSLGHRHQRTAIGVIERTYVPTSPGELFTQVVPVYTRWGYENGRRFEAREEVSVEYRVRHLERHGPPSRYTKIAERIPEVLKGVSAEIGSHVDLALDITAGGRPLYARIYEEVRRSLEESRIRVTYCPISVTGVAGGVTKSPDVGWLVPRRDLISTAQIALDERQLKVHQDLELAQTLISELEEFKPKPDQSPNDLEGWREGAEDDLVLAVAVSLWTEERFRPKKESRLVDSPILNPELR